RHKFVLSGWKFITYSVSTVIGLYIIYAEDWLLTPRLYWENWGTPGMMTFLDKLYYKVGFSSYLYGSISIIFFEPKQKDFAVMVSHHLVTLVLIFLSYMWPYYRIGCAILFLHDLSDPIMELAKMALYAGKTRLADALFATFAVTFIVTRNWIFPAYVIRSVFQYAYDAPHPILFAGISVRDAAVFCLCLLEVFHLYWSSLILKMAKNAVMNKGVSDDARNEE
ncbi:TRAM/LAG1/CLN8 homology domain-containing protein, partial [Powellomyces hirtus]